MIKQWRPILWALICLLLFSVSSAGAYNYPFDDRYVATVLSTPAEFAEVLPAEVPVKIDTINMFPERKVPGSSGTLKRCVTPISSRMAPPRLSF
jgi:hypothetical protein